MRRRVAVLVLVVVAAGVVLGLVFAGSPTTIAQGVRVDGIDVGGLQISQARALLEGKAAALSSRPVVFIAGPRRFPIRPAELGVESDWRAAVDAAQRQGSGFAPIRGFKRLGVDVFGSDVTPSTSVLTGALAVRARPDRARRQSAPAERVAAPGRDARRPRAGPAWAHARSRRGGHAPRAPVGRTRPALVFGAAADAHHAATGPRGCAPTRGARGAPRAVGPRPLRRRADDVPPDACAPRAAPLASVPGEVVARDRRTCGRRMAPEAR